jgi:hypothetical protein
VGKFVIVSTASFHDLDKALRDKNTFFSLLWPIALKESTTASINSSMLFGAYGAEATGSLKRIRD